MEADAQRIAAMTPAERAEYDVALHAHRLALGLDEATATDDVLHAIATERRRQAEIGWTVDHDDGHNDFELARAAACYALTPWRRTEVIPGDLIDRPLGWPWADVYWKPTTDRRDLIKAAALIVAEVERIDRAAAAEASTDGR